MVVIAATIFSLLLQVGVIVAEDPQLIILIADYGPVDDVGHLFKLNIHNLNISEIPVDVVAPRALDYDHTEGLIYFTDLYTKQIRRVDINGGNDTEVAKLNSMSEPEGLTLDHKTRQVFYTDKGNNLIGRVEMDNFNHTVIINTGLDKPRGIVADTKNQRLYWVDYGSNPKMETSDYDGGKRSAVIESGLSKPFEITLDEEAGRLYWTEADGVINSLNLNNSDRRAIATLSERASHMSLFNGVMYLTYFKESQSLEALPLDNLAEATSFNSSSFTQPQGIHAFSPNFEVKDPCPYGKYGRECSRCGACKGAIACEKTTGVCFRGCKPGYTTVKCTERCPSGTFGVDCQSTCNCRNSSCDVETGSCPDGCPSGWKGTSCSIRCPSGTFGVDCQSTCNCRNRSCDVETGSCQYECPRGWKGTYCSIQCTPGTFGQNCASRCSKTCKSVCDFMSGICAGGCQSGWKGAYCTERDRAKKTGSSLGLIAGVAGGVVGFVVMIIVLVVIVLCVVERKRAQRNQSEYATMTFTKDTKGIINSPYATLGSPS